ncbi:MAG: hypothetical protein H5U03_08495 [Clostridia bacterium]|nr:hypothetical protein [Clostridia bacterium]
MSPRDAFQTIGCCDARAPKVRTIFIGGAPVGLANLEQALQRVRDKGPCSREELKKELLACVREYNYVPPGREEIYAEALLAELERDQEKDAGDKE